MSITGTRVAPAIIVLAVVVLLIFSYRQHQHRIPTSTLRGIGLLPDKGRTLTTECLPLPSAPRPALTWRSKPRPQRTERIVPLSQCYNSGKLPTADDEQQLDFSPV